MSSKAWPRRSSSRSERRRWALLLLLPLLAGCSSLAYYAQSIRGQLGVVTASRPVDEVLADPATAPGVQQRLVQLPGLRRFAHERLALPDSDSYRRYAELGREAMVWSVVAAPVDSLEPRQWCYPVIGCASYRGYFSERAAQRYADGLAEEGWDVAVEPVPAYSTLGWFDDPLPSTVIHWPVTDIAGLLFHELAHERLYLAGDSAFNEAYASVVEQEGVRRWVEEHGSVGQRVEHRRQRARRSDFLDLLGDTRGRLQALYAKGLPREETRAAKAAILVQLGDGYASLKDAWGGYPGYDRWFARPLNNAHFASIGTYHRWEPALRALLRQLDGDMAAFHAACALIAQLPADRREARLQAMLDLAAAP